jgi:hypothetical protein
MFQVWESAQDRIMTGSFVPQAAVGKKTVLVELILNVFYILNSR